MHDTLTLRVVKRKIKKEILDCGRKRSTVRDMNPDNVTLTKAVVGDAYEKPYKTITIVPGTYEVIERDDDHFLIDVGEREVWINVEHVGYTACPVCNGAGVTRYQIGPDDWDTNDCYCEGRAYLPFAEADVIQAEMDEEERKHEESLQMTPEEIAAVIREQEEDIASEVKFWKEYNEINPLLNTLKHGGTVEIDEPSNKD
jgi:hypothetical protein